MTETEMVKLLHVILETIYVLMSIIFFQISLEMFFEIFITKVKPIAIGIFYRALNANDILNTFLNNSQQIDDKTNEFYLLRGFNINLHQNGTFILEENQSYELKNSTYAFVNKRKDFCQKVSLTEVMEESSRITWPCFTIFSLILLKKCLKKGWLM